MYMYIYIYVRIYSSLSLYLSIYLYLSLSLYIYIYIYIYITACTESALRSFAGRPRRSATSIAVSCCIYYDYIISMYFFKSMYFCLFCILCLFIVYFCFVHCVDVLLKRSATSIAVSCYCIVSAYNI